MAYDIPNSIGVSTTAQLSPAHTHCTSGRVNKINFEHDQALVVRRNSTVEAKEVKIADGKMAV